MLIDIHSHLKAEHKNVLRFIVGKHSIGIHPWELNVDKSIDQIQNDFLKLKNEFHSQVLAIGECGLDRVHKNTFSIEKQLQVLEWHLLWANEVKRPVVIHCVRAHSDLLMLLKKQKFKGKILLHDFSGNVDEAKGLLHFGCYFSFGARIFKEQQKAKDMIKLIPLEKLFLETDDQDQYSIEQIYQKVSEILKMDLSGLEKIFAKNLEQFFSDLDNVSSADLVTLLSNS